MRLALLTVSTFLSVLAVSYLTEALLLPHFGGRHRRMLPTIGGMPSPLLDGSSSSSTVLHYKNSTKGGSFDIERDPDPPSSDIKSAAANNDQKVYAATTINIVTDIDDVDEDTDVPNDLDFDENCFPGRDENARFRCDPSVEFWRNFQNPDASSAPQNLRDIGAIAQKFILNGQSSYFARHVGRTAYFMANAALGDAAYQASKRLSRNETTSADEAGIIRTTPRKGFLPMGMSSEIATRLILEAFLSYEQEYFNWISRGWYREPWDMATPNHRQSNPLHMALQTGRFMRESIGVLGRRSRSHEQDREVGFFKSGTTKTQQDKLYPKYYQTAFHFQGDGWMSTKSANVYETSTETLFLGRQDSMQRTSLPPIMALAKKLQKQSKKKGQKTKSRPMRVLEVACGTGRFMTFVRDNLPLDAEYTAMDLSPFYLEKASDNDSYWRRTRVSREASVSTIAPATLVQAQAENLPFAENSFDAVVCVYLYHEIPRHIRARVAAEMARVVAPGGTVVLTDSLQKGDRPPLDAHIGNFQKMNEPFYIDYTNDDLGSHFEAAGLVPETKIVRANTKSLSFSKPGELSL